MSQRFCHGYDGKHNYDTKDYDVITWERNRTGKICCMGPWCARYVDWNCSDASICTEGKCPCCRDALMKEYGYEKCHLCYEKDGPWREVITFYYFKMKTL